MHALSLSCTLTTNALMQSEWNLLNFGVRITTHITKLKDVNIWRARFCD